MYDLLLLLFEIKMHFYIDLELFTLSEGIECHRYACDICGIFVISIIATTSMLYTHTKYRQNYNQIFKPKI